MERDPLEQRLQAADPARGLLVGDNELDALLKHATRSRRSRRVTVLLGAGVAGLLAMGAVATPAAADVVTHFLAQTGLFGDAASSEEDGSEWIDLVAPDAEEYIETLYPSYLPAAPGVDREVFKRDVAQRIVAAARRTSAENDGTGVRTQVTGLQRSFEQATYNAWIRTWIQARTDDDAREQARATEVLRAACRWPAFVATDGGGVIARMRTFAAAAERGDVEGVQAAAEYNSGDDPSETGWDGTVRTWWFEWHTP